MSSTHIRKLGNALGRIVSVGAIVAFVIALVALVWWLVQSFLAVSTELQVALIAAAATVMAATSAVILSRSSDRTREIEAHFREKKLAIYDEFLQQLFQVIRKPEGESSPEEKSDELVAFLWEWQRKLVLWGGPNVINAYISWMRVLKAGALDARSFILMDDLFKAIRLDLGLSNRGLAKGAFLNLILRDADVFFLAIKTNPKISLAELTILEQQLRSSTTDAESS